jgi:alpha-tubulin suppressor-like RCC1 family protein
MPDSSVQCWGANDDGLRGTPATPGAALSVTPSPVPWSFTNVKQIAISTTFACALDGDLDVCWGVLPNQYGTASVVQETPRHVFAGAAQIGAGVEHACALRASDGAVFCWGENGYGELGLGQSVAVQGTPTQVPGVFAKNLFVSGGTTCVQLASDGSFSCWGNNSWGQIPGAPLGNVYAPQAVPAFQGATSLSIGAGFGCGVFPMQQVRCWGSNTASDLGLGITDLNYSTPNPTTIPNFDAVQVSVGAWSACARRSDGSVWCWGDNKEGLCGTSAPPMVASPVQVVAAQ